MSVGNVHDLNFPFVPVDSICAVFLACVLHQYSAEAMKWSGRGKKRTVESVFIEKQHDISTIYLNEPDSLNALSKKMKTELLTLLNEVESDPTVHIVIIAGKGRAFCAGGDVKAMAEDPYDPAEIKRNIEISARIIERIRHMPKIVIAAVHGYAAGAGMSLALAADLIIAEEETKFILSFKNVGLIPDLGIHYYLPRLVGEWKAKEWIWEGLKLTAEEANKHGLVKEVVPKGNGHPRALALARELSAGPLQALIATKLIINRSSDWKLEDIVAKENDIHTLLRGTKDHKEGVAAFFAKRPPKFSGNA
jgi:2-(1,2-epoxy-1,2-dihydrophenyl)acetyl-CoA isomerase